MKYTEKVHMAPTKSLSQFHHIIFCSNSAPPPPQVFSKHYHFSGIRANGKGQMLRRNVNTTEAAGIPLERSDKAELSWLYTETN